MLIHIYVAHCSVIRCMYRGGNNFEGLLYQFYLFHDNIYKLMGSCFTVTQYLIFLLSKPLVRGLLLSFIYFQ